MKKDICNIDLSIIIPMYNMEKYIERCLESVITITGITTEIIIIDDGSTDKSYTKAKSYQEKVPDISLIHQTNIGLSNTRNKGLSIAKGNYVLFLDSDDSVNPEGLVKIYNLAIESDADIILGRTVPEYENRQMQNPNNIIPSDLIHKILSGEVCFIETMKRKTYNSKVGNYLYKRKFLIANNREFTNMIFENEIWVLETMIVTEKILLTNIDFYHYRRRSNSRSNSISWKDRATNSFKVANYIYNSSHQYTWNESKVLKSWINIKILELYVIVLNLVLKIKDSGFIFPSDFIDNIKKDEINISEDAKPYFNNLIQAIDKKRSLYTSYIQSDFFNIRIPPNPSETIILIYNSEWSDSLPIQETLPIDISEIPKDIIVTTNRKYFNIADAVIFHLPDLMSELEVEIIKPDNQIWISWFLESEVNYPFVNDKNFMSLFDFEMSYRQNADIVVSYYNYNYLELLKDSVDLNKKKKNVCMMISSPFNQSKRLEYLEELLSYIDIDSYGSMFNNSTLSEDKGRKSKLDLYSQYKFVIAFENSIAKDYVTEKFYDPFIAGSVPIYFGAPNIHEYSPGENSFVDIRNFNCPYDLASFIKECCENQEVYKKFFTWKKSILSQALREKIIKTNPNTYTAAFMKIRDKLKERRKSD